MKISHVLLVTLALISLSFAACNKHEQHEGEGHNKIVVTSPKVKTIVLTQQYVCQIHAQKHIKVCALVTGYLDKIFVKEGQMVATDAPMFQILPVLYRARWEAEKAEAKLAKLELQNTEKLHREGVVSNREVQLYEAKLKKAEAKAALAAAELQFTEIKAPFPGVVDRQHMQPGSLIKEGEQLTTLSDNRLMWVYFNVPEARYLEYKAHQGMANGENSQLLKLPDADIELVLADGKKFEYGGGDTVTIEGKFNNETGNISFRADFPNPKGLLRHGQTGTVLIHRTQKDALVIPQRATYEILAKRYVWVVDKEGAFRPREIVIQNELDDLYVIKSGLEPDDKFVLEGVQQVHDGEKREFSVISPDEALAHLNNPAE